LAAFANTYGGWLFLGICEVSKAEPVAGTFPGIARNDVDAVSQSIRQSAADHLHPTPYFETAVLWGPNAEIGLGEDTAILCVQIPQSASAPHVHSSGHIYRRVSDASEPRPESDRYVLDQLWQRRDEAKRRHKEWFDRDPEFTAEEKKIPYLRLMLIADRWEERNVWLASDDEARAILNANDSPVGMPFDTVYTSGDQIIGRQVNGNDIHNLTATWRIERNLKTDVILPLPIYEVDSPDDLHAHLNGYSSASEFVALLKRHRSSKLRIVDLNQVFNLFVAIAEIMNRLCGIAGWTDSYHLKVKILNAWRTVPYLDVSAAIQKFSNHGIPMCLDSMVALPRSVGPNSYVEIKRQHENIEASRISLMQGAMMFHSFAYTYGIPPLPDLVDDSEPTNFYSDLMEAGKRAMIVQSRRNHQDAIGS
jgi:hypothetical protein